MKYLFFIFLSPYCICPATFALNMKNSSWNLYAIFLIQISLSNLVFWKKSFTAKCFSLLPYFRPPNSTRLFLLQQLKTNVFFPFPFWMLCPLHQRSKWLISTQCLRKGTDGLWLVKPLLTSAIPEKQREGKPGGPGPPCRWTDSWELGVGYWEAAGLGAGEEAWKVPYRKFY